MSRSRGDMKRKFRDWAGGTITKNKKIDIQKRKTRYEKKHRQGKWSKC